MIELLTGYFKTIWGKTTGAGMSRWAIGLNGMSDRVLNGGVK